MLDSFPDSSDIKSSPSAPPVLEKNSKFIDNENTVKTPSNSEKIISIFEILVTPTVAAQSHPLSWMPVAPAIIPANTLRPVYISDSSDIDPTFPLQPPPLTKTKAGESKSFKDRTSTDPTFCDDQTFSALQKNLINLAFLQIYLIWKMLLILVLKPFHCYIQNYHPVYTLHLLLMIFWIVHLKIQYFLNQLSLLNLQIILIFWDQDRYKHHFPQIQDQLEVRSLHYCVNTHNQVHLLLKIFFRPFLTSEFHWDLILVLKLL